MEADVIRAMHCLPREGCGAQSNFAVGYGEDQRRCYIIDFGLCKKYLTDTGEIVPARKNAQFRGTSVYASVYAHQHKVSAHPPLPSILVSSRRSGTGAV